MAELEPAAALEGELAAMTTAELAQWHRGGHRDAV